MDRLRKLAMKEHELEEEIERESHDGNERRWRTTKDSDTNKRKVSIQLLGP